MRDRSSRSGASSVTDELGAVDDGAIAKLRRRDRRRCGRTGTRSIVVSSGAVAAGVAALGLPSRPNDMLDAAGDRRRRPAPADAQLGRGARRPRAGAGAGAPGAARLRRPPAVPARPADADPPARARRACRSSTRTTPSPATRSRYGDNDRIAALVAHNVGAGRAGAADRPRRALHRRSRAPTRRPSSSCGSRPTTRCWRFEPSVGGSGRGSGGMAGKLEAAADRLVVRACAP